MQHHLANTAAQTDIPQVGAARRYETKNGSALKTKELPRKKSPLLRTTTKNEDQIIDHNNEIEAKISDEEIRITKKMNLQEIISHLIRISLQDQTSHTGITIRTMEDHMINAQISHSKETTEIDLEMNVSTTRMGTGKTMGTSLVLHRLKGETIHRIVFSASQEVISLTIRLSADLTVDLRLGLHTTNKIFR